MSADTLRRAAALIRERAEAATQGPWASWPDSSGNDKAAVETTWTHGDPEDGGVLVTDWCETHDAEHIASWHPDVALTVADWLSMSADHAAGRGAGCGSCVDQALNVALAYLGESA